MCAVWQAEFLSLAELASVSCILGSCPCSALTCCAATLQTSSSSSSVHCTCQQSITKQHIMIQSALIFRCNETTWWIDNQRCIHKF